MTAKPLPVFKVSGRNRTLLKGAELAYLVGHMFSDASVYVYIGPDIPVTAEMIADRFNAHPVLVEALKAIRSDDGDYGGAHLIRVAREALEKAGVK